MLCSAYIHYKYSHSLTCKSRVQKVPMLEMKTVVLLMIISLSKLVDQGHCEDITLSLCSNGTIIRWTWTDRGEDMYEILLCSNYSTCYKSVMPIKFTEATNVECKSHCNSYNISYILENFDNCSCITSIQDCSPSTMSTTTSAMSIKTSSQDHSDSMITSSTLCNNNPSIKPTQDIDMSTMPTKDIKMSTMPTQDIDMSTIPTQDIDMSTIPTQDIDMSTMPTQDILIVLLAILAALLVIVTIGWVCTCWAMYKSRKREMNINTTNIRYSEMQATNGNNTTIQPSCSQVHNNNPNTTNLCQNEAYGAEPEKTSPDPNADREYEVIPPLVDGKTRLNNAEPNDYRETPNVQRREEIPQHTAPRQPQEEEEGEGSCMQSGQVKMENGEHKDLQIGSEVYHILEPKAEDDEDNAAPYEVPVLTKTKN